MTALDWMMMRFPDIKERDDMRRIIGRYGLTGQQQVLGLLQETSSTLAQSVNFKKHVLE